MKVITLTMLGTVLLFVAGQISAENTPATANLDAERESVIADPVFNGQVHVYEAGNPSAPSVLLIHGIGNNAARDWDELIPKLVRDYHVVTFDLPGFGRSSGGNKAYTPENYVRLVKLIADKYTQGPLLLIGHSLGGAVALRYAATYPDDVRALVIADVPGILHRQSYSQYLAYLGIGVLPNFYPNQTEQLRNLVGRILGLAAKLQPDLDLIIASPIMREKVLGGEPGKIAGLAVVLDDFSGIIQRVQVPVLVIWGAKDPLAPVRTGKVLAANLAQAELKILVNSAHTPMEDAPGEFDALVLDFARRPAVTPRAWKLGSPDKIGVFASRREGSCENQRGRVFEGDYDSIVLVACRDAVLRNVRVREVRITDSSAGIEDSRIGGPRGGLRVDGSNVTITSSLIQAPVAIRAIESRLDLAGVRLIGSEAAVLAPYKSELVFSVSYIASPHTTGSIHGWYEVGPKNPL